MNRSLRWLAVAGGLTAVVLWLAGVAAPRPVVAWQETSELAPYFGFKPVEIFKLQPRSSGLLTGDLNQDGLVDLLLVDNSHSRLDLLVQRSADPVQTAAPSSQVQVNSVESSWRFEHRKIPMDRQITAVALGDFNGNLRTDVACFGLPDRLTILYQPEAGDWTQREHVRLPDVAETPGTVAAGDLNGDGRYDLAVLGKNDISLLYQNAEGRFDSPVRLMNTSDKLGLARIADLDGDGRNDLCYVADDEQSRALCVRLQTEDGRLGPELRFELDRTRAVRLADIDDEPGHEVLVVDARTGRIRVLKMQRPEAKPGEPAGRLVQYGFGSGGARDRDLATGDLDGDGLVDVVVTDPEAAQMIVFRQTAAHGLDLGTPFPGLSGANQVRTADFNGDGAAEVVVLSGKEKAIGVSRFEGGRLSFPQTLPVENEPVALEVADVTGDGRPDLVYLAREREGRSARYALRALRLDSGGVWQPCPFGTEASVPLSFADTPNRLVRLDANHDGRPDFLVFFNLDRPPLLLVTNEHGVPEESASEGGLRLGDVSAGAVFIGEGGRSAAGPAADLSAAAALAEPGGVLLVAQDNFARSLELDGSGRWRVLDQYNAAESSARIVGAAAIDLDGRPGDEIVLVDSGVKKLRVLRRDEEENVFRPWREVELGSFQYRAAHVADLNNNGRDDLLLFGNGKFAVLYSHQTDPALREVASYESKRENVYFADVVAGDLNGDGRINLAALDSRSHSVEILDFDRQRGLRQALQFKVFEAKSFGHDDGPGTEPREAAIRDVTGNGRADLILLCHDRVLVYPQDDGE